MFIAGIDEAGYGPLLGPFTAGWSLFRIPDTKTNLWEVTSDCVAQKPGRKDRRLRIDDSKRVNTGPHGRERLERAVGAFLAMEPSLGVQLKAWLEAPPSGDRDWFKKAPWFGALPGKLCPSSDTERAHLDSTLLRRSLLAGGCTFEGFGARAVPAGEWNQLLNTIGSKADVLFSISMEIVSHILQLSQPAPLRIEMDRHGARRSYASRLEKVLLPDSIQIHAETQKASLYTLKWGEREVQLRFSEGADGKFFPVALASLAAKQTRERLMDLWNQWHSERFPEVRPTKGYAQDGKRWLNDTREGRSSLELNSALLIRNR
ncbi:MAG: hypothetical protein QGH51_06040 [Planctomycetota bacterium]|jgi:ribonuclease HII|nr:hypothetical protein [Planctomycetota bacterium]MDP6941571.1 hypothetical protein [Planctomycetota bacterium]